MTHLWLRSEQRENEQRTGLTPEGAAVLMRAGFNVTVEDSRQRIIPAEKYVAAGCEIVAEASWPSAPREAIILGLKELPDDGTELPHRHIMFGHAYKGQRDGPELLRRFRQGGGRLYDLEYLTDKNGRRVAAFGYWAGYAGAAIAAKCWAAQAQDDLCEPLTAFESEEAMADDVRADLNSTLKPRPNAIVIGALGRVGSGARDLLADVGISTTDWDMAETGSGGPFPEILQHEIFLNCVLAGPNCPVFVARDAVTTPRKLTVIGDIACDPASDFNPIKVYDAATSWEIPAVRVHDMPPLDVMAIDNLPSLLPFESSQDFAEQLLPHLLELDSIDKGVWGRAGEMFDQFASEG